MYDYDQDIKISTESVATLNVNGKKVVLTEPIPYDEPPSWKTQTVLTTTHVKPEKVRNTHKHMVSLLTRGHDSEKHLLELWRELKKQYNAVLHELLTPEASETIILVMLMFSERGHESYKREVIDGRFARIVILLFEEMSMEEIKSSEVSFNVWTESDESMISPPASPTLTIKSDISTDSFMFSESIALGGYDDDPYGSVQIISCSPEQSYTTTPGSLSSDTSERIPTTLRIESGAQTNGTPAGSTDLQPLSGKFLSQINARIESSLTRRISDVKNMQEKERMELTKRFEKLEKIISQNQQTIELMQVSQKHVMEEGLQRTTGSLHGLSEKMEDMERMLERRIQEIRVQDEGTRWEKVQDLTHEVKDLRRDFSKFQDDALEKLNTVSRDLSHVKESMTSFQETQIQMKESLRNLPHSLPSYHSSSQPNLIQPLHTHLHDFGGISGPKVQPSSESQFTPLHRSPGAPPSASPSSLTDGSTTSSLNPPLVTHPQPIKLSEYKDSKSLRETSEKEKESLSDADYKSLDQERREGLDAAFSIAKTEGLLEETSDEESMSIHGDRSIPGRGHVREARSLSLPRVGMLTEGANRFPDESLNDNGGTMPISKSTDLPFPTDITHTDVNEETIVSLAQIEMQIDQAVVFQANELRKKYELPLSLDVLKVIVQALVVINVEGTESISEGGIDTVLCLDISGSVEDKAKEQAVSVISDFLTDAEELSVSRDLSENIGMVVFGTKTEILSPLTVDYSTILEKICDVQLGGTSSLHTALVLCSILMEKGGPMAIGGYIVPPRIIVFSDGRPTDDAQINNAMVEFGTKPPQIGEKVKWMVNQLHHHGFSIFSVPIGAHVNRAFLQDIAAAGGGKMVDLESIKYIKRYFLYQVTAGHVIQRCHETGDPNKCAEFIKREVHMANSLLEEEDIIHIRDIIDSSRELEDKEYHDLPPLGTRVQVKSEEATADPMQCGTVVQNLPDGWIKVQLDDGLINYYHYGDSEQEDVKIIHTPHKLRSDQLIEVGVCVREPSNRVRLGMTFRVTNSGYVDVRWEDGVISRHNFGADGILSLDIVPKGVQDMYTGLPKVKWQWKDLETKEWIDFNEESQNKLEKSYDSKDKTSSLTFQNESVRVIFEKNNMRLPSRDIVLPIRRLQS